MEPNTVLERLFVWRNLLEPSIRKHPKQLVLDGLSRYLAEFENHRYDDIDVPGQYLQMRDGNQDFVKIDKFDSLVQVIRRHGTATRRLVIRGTDGQLYPFAVQNPAGRHNRREERMLQLMRFLDMALKKGIDCRRRNLYFNVPAVIPIAGHVRLVADDPAQVTYEEILDRFCEQRGVSSEQVFLYFKEQILQALPNISSEAPRHNVELLNLRTDLFTNIIANVVPGTILAKVFCLKSSDTNTCVVYGSDDVVCIGALDLSPRLYSTAWDFALSKLRLFNRPSFPAQTWLLQKEYRGDPD
jgi:transformation/transcription domain-associated protein